MNHLSDTVSKYLDNSPDPEGEAMSLVHYLRDRFDWGGTFWNREDVNTGLTNNEPDVPPLTDDEWDAVKATAIWRKGFTDDWTMESGWETIRLALDTAGVTREEVDA